MEKSSNRSKIPFGILLITVGLVLLLKNLNLLPVEIPAYVFSWKMLLIAIGAFALFFKRSVFKGLFLISLGSYFLIPDVYGVALPSLHTIWPLVLVFIGLAVIFKKNHNQKRQECKEKWFQKKSTNMDVLDASAIMGGDSKQVSSYDFKGGKINAILGGLELDLTNCTLSKEPCVLDVTIVMGGVELIVPHEWNIVSELKPIMGGVEDTAVNKPDMYVDPAAKVILRGTIVMGGMEIKRI